MTALKTERITVPRVHRLELGSFQTIWATEFVHNGRNTGLSSDYPSTARILCALASIIRKSTERCTADRNFVGRQSLSGRLFYNPQMAGKSNDRMSRAGLDRAGRSELHYAVSDRNFARVKELIQQGADVNLADRDGWTPMHAAAQNFDEKIARLLLDSGAAVDPKDTNGNTPLSTAVFNSRGRGELIELLRERGADATSNNNFGVSPVSLARKIANYNVAQFFRDMSD